MRGSHLALKALEVVADSHGQGQQLFERLLWLVKGDGDTARLETHPRGEAIELLGHNLNRGLDQKLGPCEAILFELRQNLADVPAAAPFIVAVVALGEAAQMGDEGIAIGEAVGTDTLGNAGSEDLLGAAAADAEQKFEGGTVDERAGRDCARAVVWLDSAISRGVLRARGCFTMLLRTRGAIQPS